MNTWILIITILSGNFSNVVGGHVVMQEFIGETSCRAAATEWLNTMRQTNPSGHLTKSALCVKK